jgi:hypothetical protein
VGTGRRDPIRRCSPEFDELSKAVPIFALIGDPKKTVVAGPNASDEGLLVVAYRDNPVTLT